MAKSRKSIKSAGFTIIELIIVLAIGSLILLLVLQAIPTLLRNSRNSQRKQDVASILQAVSRFQLNNSGRFPEDADNILQRYAIRMAVYNVGSVTFRSSGPLGGDMTGLTDADVVEVWNHHKCTTNGGAIDDGAGYRDVVALFAIEQRGAPSAPQCQSL